MLSARGGCPAEANAPRRRLQPRIPPCETGGATPRSLEHTRPAGRSGDGGPQNDRARGPRPRGEWSGSAWAVRKKVSGAAGQPRPVDERPGLTPYPPCGDRGEAPKRASVLTNHASRDSREQGSSRSAQQPARATRTPLDRQALEGTNQSVIGLVVLALVSMASPPRGPGGVAAAIQERHCRRRPPALPPSPRGGSSDAGRARRAAPGAKAPRSSTGYARD